MKIVKVTTQVDLDTALAAPGSAEIWICGAGRFVVRLTPDTKRLFVTDTAHAVLRGSSHVVLRGSSHAELWESSHAVLWESSHAVLRGSSHAVLWESSHAELWESSHADAAGASSVTAFGTTKVRASKFVTIQKRDHRVSVTGDGIVVEVPPIDTPALWCEFYGVPVVDGVATLFKAVRDDYRSYHGFLYAPGSSPEAPDWDPEPECGGGLHFCAHPLQAKSFDEAATKFIACPVALVDIVVHNQAHYPQKVKARRICAPIVEVDQYGKPLAVEASA